MPKGTPLTPKQLRKAAEVYEQTGSYSEAARAIGVDEGAVRKRFAPHPKRSELNTRAIDQGLRDGRRALREVQKTARELLKSGLLEPRDLDAVARSVSVSIQRMLDLKRAPLERAKLRREVEVLDAKAKGLLPPEVTVITSPAEVQRLFEQSFGHAGALLEGTASGDTATDASVSNVGSESVPVSEAMDPRAE